ncbi:MAG: hypothetical protein OTJ44_05800 [Planctomycetota bacterium]|nr:hypothetical protein [Planctomycetota bacterium]
MNKPFSQVAVLSLVVLLPNLGCGSMSPYPGDPHPSSESTLHATEEPDIRWADSDTPAVESTVADQEPGGTELQENARAANELRTQKSELLIHERLINARAAFADGRLLDAENQLLLALDLAPTHPEVRALLDQVQIARGVGSSDLTGSSGDARLRLQARVERLRAETETHFDRSARLLSEGDYEEAIGALRLAQANVASKALNMDWNGLDQRVEQALAQAAKAQASAMAAQRNAAKEATFHALRKEENVKLANDQQRLRLMLKDAVHAFEAEDYDESITLSEKILEIDPLDSRAMELRDAAYRTRHERVSANFIKDRIERFRLWSESIEESMIPTSDLYTAPTSEYWKTITEKRAGFGDFFATDESDAVNRLLQAQVKEARIPGLQMEGETDLNAVIDQLRTYTDIPFVVTPAAIEAVDNEGIEFNLSLSSEISVENALKVIVSAAGPEVVFTFQNEVVYITTKEQAYGNVATRAHDVQDLTVQFTDHSGPRIDRIWLTEMEPNEEEEGSIYGGPIGEPRSLVNPDELADLVMASVDPGTWDDNTAEYGNGFLIVKHTPATQQRVHEFLQTLRRYHSTMVSIEARFLTIQKDFLHEIGVDFRGLGEFPSANDLVTLDDVLSGLEDNASAGLDNGGDGLPVGAEDNPSAGLFFNDGGTWEGRARTENMVGDYGTDRLTAVGGLTMQFAFLDDAQTSMILRAVEKSSRAQEMNTATVLTQNTMRAYMTVLNQVTYIQDMDVEVAQAASIADPIVGVVSDGIVIDVRPIVSHDRKYITLELQPTIATLLRPIPEFTSSLAGLTTPVTLQLPELSISSAKTNAVVPDGGTVVIAGLRKLLDIEQRSEIPFLARIPVLSLLFKTEGQANEKEDIIVLIRAQIVDTAEISDMQDNA